jgi:hypothetical protein
MTQPMPSPQTGPTSPLAPPTLWGRLDPAIQQQLAHCLCDLIRQMRSVPALIRKEAPYDGDSH